MTEATAEAVYAKCNDCGKELADRVAVSAHGAETLTPVTGEGGVTARGHSISILNPTEEEQRASRIRWAITSALDDLYEELDEDVRDGDFTAAEVKEGLRWFGLDDGWDDFMAEVDADEAAATDADGVLPNVDCGHCERAEDRCAAGYDRNCWKGATDG